MVNINFSSQEKIEAFDRISKCFYDKNFSKMSKSDIELLMFDIYLKKLINDNESPDGTIDYNKCSDYVISKALGITQQKVRNMKVRDQLVYPVEFDWEKSFSKLLENARVDADNKVTINIPDPNLYIEIQNFLESSGGYIEKQLNTKLLVIRAEYLVELVVKCDDEGRNKKKIIKAIEESFKDQRKEDKAFDERNIGKSLIIGAVNISTILANISSFINPENSIFNVLKNLFSGKI